MCLCERWWWELNRIRNLKEWKCLRTPGLHTFPNIFIMGLLISEGLTKGSPDFNIWSGDTQRREEVRRTVSCDTLHWCGQTWVMLFWGRVDKAKVYSEDTVRGSFKRWGLMEEGRTQATVVRPVQQAAPGSAVSELLADPSQAHRQWPGAALLFWWGLEDASSEPVSHQWSHWTTSILKAGLFLLLVLWPSISSSVKWRF